MDFNWEFLIILIIIIIADTEFSFGIINNTWPWILNIVSKLSQLNENIYAASVIIAKQKLHFLTLSKYSRFIPEECERKVSGGARRIIQLFLIRNTWRALRNFNAWLHLHILSIASIVTLESDELLMSGS